MGDVDATLVDTDIQEPKDEPQIDYKKLYEESTDAIEQIKKAQSGSDATVTKLSTKLKELELEKMTENERKKLLDEEKDRELEQFRLKDKQNVNKIYALEQLAKNEIDSELVNILNLSLDQTQIVESIGSLKKAVDIIKTQAVDDYKNEHRPGFKSSIAFDKDKPLTVDQLMTLKKTDPDAYDSLPIEMKRPPREKRQIL